MTNDSDPKATVEKLGSGGGKFLMGNLYATPGALAAVVSDELLVCLGRHARGDWGECGTEDWEANERALVEGSRIFSVYKLASGVKLWIITEADRASTTALLPEEY